MSAHPPDSDEALAGRLRTELPRYAAPAHVRVALVEGTLPRARPAWLAPVLASAATVLVLGCG